MLVSGFTVVRNAQLMGYPITQSIRSILPRGRHDWEMRDYKNLLSDVLERFAGHRFGERKNYILLKSP